MTLAGLLIAFVALVLVALLWSPIAALVIVVLALLGQGLCALTGVGGERFFSGSAGRQGRTGASTAPVRHRHRHP